ncbi:MAG: NAD-dependent epimerase/dehydratase family protein [Rhodoferax sp.]|nr:NAD-dependent epimerase/dehydratase family protein [Rhodoferax sp.]
MNLLIIGGSVFVGRHMVEAALARGHRVTVFNRGTHAADLAVGVEQVRGDRDVDLAALAGRHFESVIDCCAYTPEQITRAAAVLSHLVDHYVFISTISVYKSFPPGKPYDETAPVGDGDDYGGRKARAEAVLEAAFPGRAICVRPGLIAGPYDPTGRLTYWPVRVAKGGTVLAPGRPGRPVQWMDARDLACWCVALAERKTTGVFNAPGATDTMANFLEACRLACNPQAAFKWMPDAQLLAADVAPWTGMPLWIPENDEAFGGMLLGSEERARAAGLSTRPWQDTLRDTLQWAQAAGEKALGIAGIAHERESALLATL